MPAKTTRFKSRLMTPLEARPQAHGPTDLLSCLAHTTGMYSVLNIALGSKYLASSNLERGADTFSIAAAVSAAPNCWLEAPAGRRIGHWKDSRDLAVADQ